MPLAGIEPALLAELDFESSASTNSAIGASDRAGPDGADYTVGHGFVNWQKNPARPLLAPWTEATGITTMLAALSIS